MSCVTFDTRDARPGALHCCIPGSKADGHSYAGSAIQAGAVALLCERLLPTTVAPESVVQICVGPDGVRPAMASVASTLWDRPADALHMLGVTGTSGKTTVTHLLGAVLEAHGWPTAVIGTLGGALTTPEAPVLQEILAGHRDSGGVAVAMEVSSHALVMHRVDAVRFDVAAFTNLSHDHLDFHHTIQDYFEAKARLFSPERAEIGLANRDDPWGRELLERGRIPMLGYSVSEARDVDVGLTSSSFRWKGHQVNLRLGGLFNVANAVAAARIAEVLGVPSATVARGLSEMAGVPGRYEALERGQDFSVIVDYAHKPDALEKLLNSVRRALSPRGRLIVVFGCGGDRDRSKRPVMGEVATRLADLVVLTSDNPRGEDPGEITKEVLAGVSSTESLVIEQNRAKAISLAIEAAATGDAVVIAGKGHETGQVGGWGRLDFDDRQVAGLALERRTGRAT